MKKLLLTTFFVLGLLFSGSLQVYAQSGVGKLVGTIVDAVTKEPLIGANVIVMGTELGAATNLDGKYFVLNIVPGTYDIRVTFVGYSPKVIKDIRIVSGITYELNADLQTGIALNEIVITGEKKFFEEKSTNSTKVMDASDINRLPVKGVEKLASLQAGVVIAEGSGGASGNATINVRGGRGNEVLYIVDGVPQNDAYTGANNAQLSNSAIDQISFQIGGYEAKYGQAQSGIVNVTTKSGEQKWTAFTDVQTSSLTDDYGSNLYTANISGPIIPNMLTIFASAERGWYLDGNPSAVSLKIPTAGIDSKVLPNNDAGVWRFTGRTYTNLNPFSVRLGANINTRQFRSFSMLYAKNNSEHNPITKTQNYSYSGRVSHNISSNSFWNLNVGYKIYNSESGDGVWFDNLEAYGDKAANAPYITTDGSRVLQDANQIFYGKGRVSNGYTRQNTKTLSIDLDFTSQVQNHLFEVGGGFNSNTLRIYQIAPVTVAVLHATRAYELRLDAANPYYFGFDIYGKNFADATTHQSFNEDKAVDPTQKAVDVATAVAPRKPVMAYAYLQDRFELSDLVLNVGVRMDYFDSKADVLKDPTLPFAGGSNPNAFDDGDFEVKKAEVLFSPRIGVGFPISTTTVFHAQFGKFVQPPNLTDTYTSTTSLQGLTSPSGDNAQYNTGNVGTESTTQYEVGFRQVFGANAAAINITAFYKNTTGLVSLMVHDYRYAEGGNSYRYFSPTNGDFGTVKGLALTLNIARISYFSLNLDYTYSIAEGTGSSTSGAYTAAFRNQGSTDAIPIVIAPLDYDQRHTGVATLDFYKDYNSTLLGPTSLSLIFAFSSGRPYTPLEKMDITDVSATNLGETKGYVNSAYGPGSSRLDLKLEQTFYVMGHIGLTPYLWVENLFNTENATTVYRSTGSPYTTGFLATTEGAKKWGALPGTASDYSAYERNPGNFGPPRTVKLGIKVNFSVKGINL